MFSRPLIMTGSCKWGHTMKPKKSRSTWSKSKIKYTWTKFNFTKKFHAEFQEWQRCHASELGNTVLNHLIFFAKQKKMQVLNNYDYMKINVEYAACYYKVSDFQARVSRNLLDFTIRHICIYQPNSCHWHRVNQPLAKCQSSITEFVLRRLR